MTNKERLSKVIEKDFDKNKNYNLVISKTNKKNFNIKIFKYASILVCILLLLSIFYIGNSFNENKNFESEVNYYNYLEEINLGNVINISPIADRIIDISNIEALKIFSTNVFIVQ